MHPYLRLQIIIRPTDPPPASPEGMNGITGLSLATGHPSLPSPLIRRVLGKALVDLFCPFDSLRCQPPPRKGAPPAHPADHCHLADTCPYGVFFASGPSSRPPFAVYVLPKRDPGARRRLEFTLYGPNWPLYPWVLAGLQCALRKGLGKTRKQWEIVQVLRISPSRQRRKVCGSDLTKLPATLEPDRFGLTAERYLTPRPIEVRLLSPTRLIRDGKLIPGDAPVPLEILVARTLDRFRGLYSASASEILRPQVRKTIEAEAARVPLLRDRTRWLEVRDYSARSRRELLLGGKVGCLSYGEEATRFFPILQAGEILHLGKNAASGCGRIQVDPSR